jgi:hypothetical protein
VEFSRQKTDSIEFSLVSTAPPSQTRAELSSGLVNDVHLGDSLCPFDIVELVDANSIGPREFCSRRYYRTVETFTEMRCHSELLLVCQRTANLAHGLSSPRE